MPRFLFVVLGLAILFPLGALASSGGFHGMPGPRLERALERLDLDASTWEQVDAILDAAAAEGEPLRDEIRAAHEQTRALMEAESPDVDAIMAQAEAIGALHVEARKLQLRSWFAVRAVLTQAQIDELAEKRGNRRADFRRRDKHHRYDGSEPEFDRVE